MHTMKLVRLFGAAAVAAAIGSGGAGAQEVVLKVEHFLGPQSTAQQQLLGPWCEKIGKESGGKLKCQIYPAMQLGGTPPQLFDHAKDGVADVIWTVPTYQAGRFAKSEVFELPFMIKSAETGSPALWEYIQKNSLDEFKGTKLILAHVHDGAVLHFASQAGEDAGGPEGAEGARARRGSGPRCSRRSARCPCRCRRRRCPRRSRKASSTACRFRGRSCPGSRSRRSRRRTRKPRPGSRTCPTRSSSWR